MTVKHSKNVLVRNVVIILSLLQTLVFADWATSSQFDFDGDGVIGLSDFAIFANHWGQAEPELIEPDITWVYVNDPGVVDRGGFTGYMGADEVTNEQYCQFLNAALDTGDIVLVGNNVTGSVGTNTGVDFAGLTYYNLTGVGYTFNGAVNGGAARINYSDGIFSADSGFENHPVTHVSWYGAVAFSNYYGWRLPTEWEWNAVADYDGTYVFGTGVTTSNLLANYFDSLHPDGTTPVGAFGYYGYGMADMSGNAWEWTSTLASPPYPCRIVKGGHWYKAQRYTEIWNRYVAPPESVNEYIGFRVCR